MKNTIIQFIWTNIGVSILNKELFVNQWSIKQKRTHKNAVKTDFSPIKFKLFIPVLVITFKTTESLKVEIDIA